MLLKIFLFYWSFRTVDSPSQYSLETAEVGDKKTIFYPKRSQREKSEDFVGYRAYKDNVTFSRIEKGSQDGNCVKTSGSLYELGVSAPCERYIFLVHNDTHLSRTILNVTASDSGIYKVEHRFQNLEADKVEIWRLHVKENPSVFSPTSVTDDGSYSPTDPSDRDVSTASVPSGAGQTGLAPLFQDTFIHGALSVLAFCVLSL